VKPVKRGKMKATFYYNTTNWPDILNVPVSFSINDHKYIFNQTNDYNDVFYWKKRNTQGTRFKYLRYVNTYGSVRMDIDVKKQYGTLSLQSVNLEAYATNRTGYHSTRLQIGDLDVTVLPWYQGFVHQSGMRYEDDLLWMRDFLLVYDSVSRDQLMVRGIARYNAYTNTPLQPVMFPVALTVRGESINSTIPEFTRAGTATRTGNGTYTVTGPLQGKFTFSSGQFLLKQHAPFPFFTASYQSNCNIFVTLKLGDPVFFEKSIAVRAQSVQKNRISY
jgi:hypothetical protein